MLDTLRLKPTALLTNAKVQPNHNAIANPTQTSNHLYSSPKKASTSISTLIVGRPKVATPISVQMGR
jgi:hypothetical protein